MQVRQTGSLIYQLSLRLEPLGSRTTSDSGISGALISLLIPPTIKRTAGISIYTGSEMQTNKLNRNFIRRAMRAQRRSLSASERSFSSFNLLSNLRTQIWYLRAQRVAAYLCQDGEISLAPVITDCMDRNKNICLPRVHKSKPLMQFLDWQPGQPLTSNRYGILEPIGARTYPLMAQSLILTPLVAFDSRGNRVGMGGGYYDRMLGRTSGSTHRPLVIGVAYDFQQLESLDSEDWDQSLDGIVTNKEVIAVSARLRALNSCKYSG